MEVEVKVDEEEGAGKDGFLLGPSERDCGGYWAMGQKMGEDLSRRVGEWEGGMDVCGWRDRWRYSRRGGWMGGWMDGDVLLFTG